MKLLLVEDNDLVARVMVDLIEMAGHQVEHAASLGAALAHLERETFHVVIADLGLEHGELGIDLLRWVARNRPEVRRVLMTGVAPRQIPEDPAVQLFLPKPCSFEDLERAFSLEKPEHHRGDT